MKNLILLTLLLTSLVSINTIAGEDQKGECIASNQSSDRSAGIVNQTKKKEEEKKEGSGKSLSK